MFKTLNLLILALATASLFLACKSDPKHGPYVAPPPPGDPQTVTYRGEEFSLLGRVQVNDLAHSIYCSNTDSGYYFIPGLDNLAFHGPAGLNPSMLFVDDVEASNWKIQVSKTVLYRGDPRDDNAALDLLNEVIEHPGSISKANPNLLLRALDLSGVPDSADYNNNRVAIYVGGPFCLFKYGKSIFAVLDPETEDGPHTLIEWKNGQASKPRPLNYESGHTGETFSDPQSGWRLDIGYEP